MPEPEFRLPAFETPAFDPLRQRRRAVAVAVAATVAIGGLGTALFLGSLGYDFRRSQAHERRLKGILVQTPTVSQVTEGLKEKAPLLLVVETDNDLQNAVERWGLGKTDEIRSKAGEWPQLRVYSAGDMVYFIYFDGSNIMKDYVYVTNEGET